MVAARRKCWLRGGRSESCSRSRTARCVFETLAISLPCSIAALMFLACSGPAPTLSAPKLKTEKPYSVQMHVHGSFSEGAGSVDSHSYEASDLGLDVLWWSDHDFRITSYRHATRFGFEGPEESLDRNESWRVRSSREERHKKYLKPDARRTPAGSLAEFTASDAREGERSLRLRMTNAGGKFRGPFKFLGAGRSLAVRPLALDVTLQLEIHAEALGDDARAIVEVQLSEHPAHLDVPYARYVIRYVLDNSAVAPRRTGAIYEIPVRYRPGQWNRLSLPLTRDAIEGFPFIEGDDNALLRMAVGVEARNGRPLQPFSTICASSRRSRGHPPTVVNST